MARKAIELSEEELMQVNGGCNPDMINIRSDPYEQNLFEINWEPGQVKVRVEDLNQNVPNVNIDDLMGDQ